MAQQKRFWSEEISDREVGRDLTECELMAICGGTGGSFDLSNWFASPKQDKTAKTHSKADAKAAAKAQAANDAAVKQFVDGFNALTALTNGLVGSII